MISQVAEMNDVSKQTVRKYLCYTLVISEWKYLRRCLSIRSDNFPQTRGTFGGLEFYYTQRKHSLNTAYIRRRRDIFVTVLIADQLTSCSFFSQFNCNKGLAFPLLFFCFCHASVLNRQYHDKISQQSIAFCHQNAIITI